MKKALIMTVLAAILALGMTACAKEATSTSVSSTPVETSVIVESGDFSSSVVSEDGAFSSSSIVA